MINNARDTDPGIMFRDIVHLWCCDEDEQVHPDLLSFLPLEREPVEAGPIVRMEDFFEFFPCLNNFIVSEFIKSRDYRWAEENDYVPSLLHEGIVIIEGLNVVVAYLGTPFEDIAALFRDLVLDGGQSHTETVLAFLLY